MDKSDFSFLISIVMMLIGVATFFIAQFRNSKKDAEESEKKLNDIRTDNIEMKAILKGVNETVTETKSDVKNLTNNLAEIDKRLTKVEENLKTAFRRIDELKEK